MDEKLPGNPISLKVCGKNILENNAMSLWYCSCDISVKSAESVLMEEDILFITPGNGNSGVIPLGDILVVMVIVAVSFEDKFICYLPYLFD